MNFARQVKRDQRRRAANKLRREGVKALTADEKRLADEYYDAAEPALDRKIAGQRRVLAQLGDAVYIDRRFSK